MAERGFELVVVGRDPERTRQAAGYVQGRGRGARVRFHTCDFSSLEEVRVLGQKLLQSEPRIDVLINNAGLWHTERKLSRDGYEETFAVNHLAPFLLTHLLLDRLKQSAPSRIVHVSSRLHEFQRRFDFDDLGREHRYRGIHVYAQSKLANVMFSTELAERLRDSGVDDVTSNALHPGDVISDILRDQPLLYFLGRQVSFFFDSPAQASVTSVHLATDEALARTSGKYFVKCSERASSRAVHDAEARKRLWDLSAEMAGL